MGLWDWEGLTLGIGGAYPTHLPQELAVTMIIEPVWLSGKGGES